MIINFWQNILSPHQSASLRALADAGRSVNLIAEQETLPERKMMGWGRPDFGRCNVLVAPRPQEITALLQRTPGAVNIVSGSRCARPAPLFFENVFRDTCRLACWSNPLTHAV